MPRIRSKLVKEAVNEMLSKIADMQMGCPLTQDEWNDVIRVVCERVCGKTCVGPKSGAEGES